MNILRKVLLTICVLILAGLGWYAFERWEAAEANRDTMEHCMVEWRETAEARQSDVSELSKRIETLTAERDRLRAELKLTAEALGIEQNSESVELSVFRDKLLELEKRLERAKIDSDNLANELATCKSERDAAETEFVKALDDNLKLRNAVSEEINCNLSLQADLKCCQEELGKCRAALARKPKCRCECGCQRRAEPVPKPKLKRKHRR